MESTDQDICERCNLQIESRVNFYITPAPHTYAKVRIPFREITIGKMALLSLRICMVCRSDLNVFLNAWFFTDNDKNASDFEVKKLNEKIKSLEERNEMLNEAYSRISALAKVYASFLSERQVEAIEKAFKFLPKDIPTPSAMPESQPLEEGVGFMEGDFVKVISGEFKGKGARIKSIKGDEITLEGLLYQCYDDEIRLVARDGQVFS